MAQYEEQFCDAVEILINEAVSKLGFDCTYQVIIKDDSNAGIGVYKVQYQDEITSASTIGNEVYNVGDVVYMLVPENDWSNEKKIIGYSDSSDDLEGTGFIKNGNYWISEVERVDDNLYYITVTNGVSSIKSTWTVETNSNGDTVWTCDSGQSIDMIGFKSSGSVTPSSSSSSSYILPVATTTTLGGVKIDGSTIIINENGIISTNIKVDIATTSSPGIVKPDGDTITIDSDGTIHGATKVDIATVEKVGVVKPDGTTISISTDGTISTVEKEIRIHDHIFETLDYTYNETNGRLKLFNKTVTLEHEIDNDDYENYNTKRF